MRKSPLVACALPPVPQQPAPSPPAEQMGPVHQAEQLAVHTSAPRLQRAAPSWPGKPLVIAVSEIGLRTNRAGIYGDLARAEFVLWAPAFVSCRPLPPSFLAAVNRPGSLPVAGRGKAGRGTCFS